MVRDFVYELAKTDDRIVILKPKVPIKPMLERDGYPFKSKEHSLFVDRWQRKGMDYKSVRAYIGMENTVSGRPMYRPCPKKLKYQFTGSGAGFKISDKCCERLKKEPLEQFALDNNTPYHISGIMVSEGGRRQRAQCLAFKGKKLWGFHPLVPVTKDWEDWLIQAKNIKICDIYKPPYNFERTGCKGCPFALELQKELDILQEFFPNERKQCEIIWAPVYAEYRRLGYRLKKDDGQLAFDYV